MPGFWSGSNFRYWRIRDVSGRMQVWGAATAVPAGEDKLQTPIGAKGLSMSKRVDIAGASGQAYSFYLLEEGAALKPIGVTYVIAEQTEQHWRVLETGESSNLAQKDWATSLEACRRAHPKAQLLIRLNVSRSVREAEGADIAAASRPSAVE